MDTVVKIFQLLAYTAAFVGIIFTISSYIKNNRIKRGEWLKSLFEKFFEEATFGKVRIVIEYERIGSFLEFDSKQMAINHENEELLVNYLNFFEFIAVLVKNKHVTKAEIEDLFGYYLELMKKDAFIKRYLEQFGFENLIKFLNELGK